MEHLPLLISLASLLVWLLVSLLVGGRVRGAVPGVALGLALIQLGCAIWFAASSFSTTDSVQWSAAWFRASPTELFEVKLAVDFPALILWLAVSIVVVMSAYFQLLRQIHGKAAYSRGEKAALPLLALGAILTMTAGNFVVYYFGWSLILPATFLALGLTTPSSDKKGVASFRYFILSMIPETLFLAGILGIYSALGSLDFARINEATSSSAMPAWAIICILLGVMFRTMQIPFMQTARHVAVAGPTALPVLLVGHVALSAAVFLKLYPAMAQVSGIHHYAVIPALTALVAAAMLLPEREPSLVAGWLSSYVSASVFLSGLAGDYQAVQALALTGTLTVFLFASILIEFKPGQHSSHWLVGLGALFLCGLPVAGWGWARYIEYLGLLRYDLEALQIPGALLGTKVLSDLLVGMALWAIAKEYWFSRESASQEQGPRWEALLPFIALFILVLAVTVGGRPLGGMFGLFDLDAFPSANWFEKKVITPTISGRDGFAAVDLIGSDQDIIARILLIGVMLFPAVLALVWLFRDKERLAEFTSFTRRMTERLHSFKGDKTLLWDFMIRPVNGGLGRALAYFDSRIIDYFLADRWLRPARWVRELFRTVEHSVLDKKIVDGLGEGVGALGKALRLLQNGQVQFYFALGLILMAVILAKFSGLGG